MTPGVFIALTGRPGIGKTTAVTRVTESLKREGIKVGGIYTNEVRQQGVRVGFDVVDILTGKTTTLARVGHAPGPRVGRYVVYVDEFETHGVKAIEEAIENCMVVVVDEIGPMELKSIRFTNVIEKLLNLDKPVVVTVHLKSQDPIVARVKAKAGGNLIVLDERNRDNVVGLVVDKIKQALG